MAVTTTSVGTAYKRLTYPAAETMANIQTAVDAAIVALGWTQVYNLNNTTLGGAGIYKALCDGCTTTFKYMRLIYIGGTTGYVRMSCGSDAKYGNATTNTATETFTQNGHGMVDNDIIYFHKQTTSTGITLNLRYYIINAATNTFQVSTTPGGGPVALGGSNGSCDFTCLKNNNYNYDLVSGGSEDYDSQPISTGASGVTGSINIYATIRWCVLFSACASLTARIGGATNGWWSGVFEVKRENPGDSGDNGYYPFGYISGYCLGQGGTYTFMPPVSYWGESGSDPSTPQYSAQYSGVASSYGASGYFTGPSGALGAVTPTLCTNYPKFTTGFTATNPGWALDLRLWEHGPSSSLAECLCVGRIFGLKATQYASGGVGSTTYVMVDADYLYSPTGTALVHTSLVNWNASYKHRFLIPQDA